MSKVIKYNGSGLVDIVRRFLKYGNICIAYEQTAEKYALSKGSELSAAGYNVRYEKILNATDTVSVSNDYVIGIGADLIDSVLADDPRRKSIIILKPNILNCISARLTLDKGYRMGSKHLVDCRIVDSSLMMTRDEQAELIGEIATAYQITLDYRLQSYIKYSDTVPLDTLKKLDEILLRERLSYDEILDALCLSVDLIDNADADFSGAVFIAARLIARDRGMRFGDACLLCSTCYLYSAYSLIGSDVGLTLTVEKTKIAESIAVMSGIDKRAVILALGIIPSGVIANNDYVIKEYANELKAFIGDRFPLLTNLCKLWRRLKSDVGRDVSRAITIKEILKIVSDATLIGNSYGVLRHYKEMGVV